MFILLLYSHSNLLDVIYSMYVQPGLRHDEAYRFVFLLFFIIFFLFLFCFGQDIQYKCGQTSSTIKSIALYFYVEAFFIFCQLHFFVSDTTYIQVRPGLLHEKVEEVDHVLTSIF